MHIVNNTTIIITVGISLYPHVCLNPPIIVCVCLYGIDAMAALCGIVLEVAVVVEYYLISVVHSYTIDNIAGEPRRTVPLLYYLWLYPPVHHR